jgi:FkbM family methyltransferase
MNKATIEYKNFNGGKKTDVYYPISEQDLNNQLYEIFVDQYYKPKYLENDVCVDIGANVGMATTYLKQFCKRIYSIEPTPSTYEALVMNVGKMEGVKTFNHAIYTTNDQIKLYGYKNEPEQTSHPGSYLNDTPTKTSEIFVPCKTLATFMKDNGIEKIDVLKIDCEGSEYEIFCDDTFNEVSDKIDCIVGESHYTNEFGIPQLAQYLLERKGFRFEFRRGRRKPNVWKEGVYKSVDGDVKDFKFPLWTNFIAWKPRKK